jgi:hypothetical protein
MGIEVYSHCNCGYQIDFRVGGSRAEYLTISYFPHYCESCGLVSVNVARPRPKSTLKEKLLIFIGIRVETVEEPLCCPECQSQDIKRYGKEPMVGSKRSRSAISRDDHYLDNFYNFCPSCKQYSMCCEISAFVD